MESKQLDENELQELVKKAQQGSTEAFSRVYDHFFESVYRYVAFRMQAEAAEDVVADIFMKAWEKLHTFRPQKNIPFGAWLFRIARHAVIDTYRKHREWEEVPEDIPDQDALNRAEASVKRRYLMTMVRGAMDKLPRRYRDVLHLSYVADLPHHEVARVLKTSEGSVRILKFRVLKKLEKLLPPEANDS